jgi:hypothetical protein
LPVPSKIEKLEEYYPNKSPAEKHVWNFISTQPNEEDSDDYYSEEEEQEEYEEDEEEQEQDKKVPEARPKKTVFQSNSLPSTAQWFVFFFEFVLGEVTPHNQYNQYKMNGKLKTRKKK